MRAILTRLAIAVLFCGLLPLTALADCASPYGPPGGRYYDTSGKIYKFCDGTNWKDFICPTSGGGSPTGCSNIGDLCSDGSIFAGDTNMYVTDVNQSTSIQWKTSTGTNDINPDSDTDGQANHANRGGSLSLFPAFELCENLDRHGHQDWYLPARDELTVVYSNKAVIDANAGEVFGAYSYWSSTEASTTNAHYTYFGSGLQADVNKNQGWRVRCVRRDSAGCFDTWTPHESNRQWFRVASSSDGAKLAAVDNYGSGSGGKIYTSADSGLTWTARESNRYWYDIASSSDGTKLVAVDNVGASSGGKIYTSSDSGVSWTARDSDRRWYAVASSADGTKLVAVVGGLFYTGQIYTSSNSGVSWTARESSRHWIDVASSADGTKLVAIDYNGQIYTSADSGVNWTAHESNRQWYAVTSSADGTKLAATVYAGQIYTSTDSGVSWTARETNRNWYAIASSADGTKLVAAVGGLFPTGQIYITTDSGLSWTPHETDRTWIGVASSSDGGRIVAAVYGGQIYTSACAYSGPGCVTLGSCAHEGDLGYEPAETAFKYCDGADWVKVDGGTGGGGGEAPPTGCPTIGDLCSDGSYYIGQVGGNDIYTADASTETTMTWNNGSTNRPQTGFTNTQDGPGNTGGLVALSDSGSPYEAAEYCDGLATHGHTDWYLPAQEELNLFYHDGSPVAAVNTSGTFYWSSTEFTAVYSTALAQAFSSGFLLNINKEVGLLIRCVRRPTSPPSNVGTACTLAGATDYDNSNNQLLFCDGSVWHLMAE